MVLLQGLITDAPNGAFERLGVSGILVAAAYYLLKYFAAAIAQKDTRVAELTDRFIQMTKEFGDISRENQMKLQAATVAMQELTEAIRNDHRRPSARRET